LVSQAIHGALMASLTTRSRLLLAGVLIMALVHVPLRTAQAEVRVEGANDFVRVEVRDASVHEALAALSAMFGLSVLNSAALNQPVSGTYQGSLQQVIARLLAGRDYVAIYSAGNAEIRIFGSHNDGRSQPIARPPRTAIVQNIAPTVAPAAPPPNSFVDKGRLMFAPR
jgi:hypothetical protein